MLTLHTHDCESCWPLGRYTEGEREFDLYAHKEGLPTVIARYGSAPEDYTSGLGAARVSGPLAVALVRALKDDVFTMAQVAYLL